MRGKTLCAIIAAITLASGCKQTPPKPKLPEGYHLAMDGRTVLTKSDHIAGVYCPQLGITDIANCEDLPPKWHWKWEGDQRIVFDEKENELGYLRYIDPTRERVSHSSNPVQYEALDQYRREHPDYNPLMEFVRYKTPKLSSH